MLLLLPLPWSRMREANVRGEQEGHGCRPGAGGAEGQAEGRQVSAWHALPGGVHGLSFTRS